MHLPELRSSTYSYLYFYGYVKSVVKGMALCTCSTKLSTNSLLDVRRAAEPCKIGIIGKIQLCKLQCVCSPMHIVHPNCSDAFGWRTHMPISPKLPLGLLWKRYHGIRTTGSNLKPFFENELTLRERLIYVMYDY